MKRSLLCCLALTGLLVASPSSAQLVVPELTYESVPDFLKLPDDIHLGEVPGVAVAPNGNIYVYSRLGAPQATMGTYRTLWRTGAARLFEFDKTGKFVKEIGQGMYSFTFAERVRVDKDGNIWTVDSGSNMIHKFSPEGRLIMTMGRKPEALRVPAPEAPPAGGPGAAAPQGVSPGSGIPGDNFNRPSDVGWDAAGNIFVADGHGGQSNARIAKFDKTGKFIKSWGSRGSEPGQFNAPHALVVDVRGNVYVADRSNNRIQVFDNDGNFKTMFLNVGTPFTMCITEGPQQYIFTSNSNSALDMEDGEVYKITLDGKIVGKFGRAGRLLGEFNVLHSLDCRNENELYAGENAAWRVQKLLLKGPRQSSQR